MRFIGARAVFRVLHAASNSGHLVSDRSTFVMKFVKSQATQSRVLNTIVSDGMVVTRLRLHADPLSGTRQILSVSVSGLKESPHVSSLALKLKRIEGVDVCDLPPLYVPWFPTKWTDLQDLRNRTLTAGAELQCDHPGFSDGEYRKRRMKVAAIAEEFEGNEPDGSDIPQLEYTASEVKTWSVIYSELTKLYEKLSCDEHIGSIKEMENRGILGPRKIPQLNEMSKHLFAATGFVIRPVCGLLSSRDFLNALAFRTFCSTQYIRHGSVPFYTPEPDVVHEILGHVPMFLNKDYADFVSLSSKLVGIDKVIAEIRVPLDVIREEVRVFSPFFTHFFAPSSTAAIWSRLANWSASGGRRSSVAS